MYYEFHNKIVFLITKGVFHEIKLCFFLIEIIVIIIHKLNKIYEILEFQISIAVTFSIFLFACENKNTSKPF